VTERSRSGGTNVVIRDDRSGDELKTTSWLLDQDIGFGRDARARESSITPLVLRTQCRSLRLNALSLDWHRPTHAGGAFQAQESSA